jgi:hypothetical protein
VHRDNTTDALGVVTGVAPGDATIYVDDGDSGDSFNANALRVQLQAASKKQKVVHSVGAKLTQTNYPDASGPQEIKAGQTAYITSEPVMPQLTAELAGTAPAGANVTWTLTSSYARRGNRDNKTFTSGPIPATQPWNIGTAIGQNFFGGTVTLTYEIDKIPKSKRSISFTIKGKNPLDQTAKNYITSVQGQFRFAWAIVQHESRTYDHALANDTSYNQFYASDARGGIANVPKFGTPDGWGMFQRDTSKGGPPSVTAEVWNWKANIDAGIAELGRKQADQQRYFDSVKLEYNDPTKYPAGTYEDPPTNFYPQGTGTLCTPLEAGTMTLYNGTRGCPSVTLKDAQSGITHPFQNPWQFTPTAPSGQKWYFYPNYYNYVYEVLYNEFEVNLPYVEGP